MACEESDKKSLDGKRKISNMKVKMMLYLKSTRLLKLVKDIQRKV